MSQENINITAAAAKVTASANGAAVAPTYAFSKGFNSTGAFGAAAGNGGTHTAAGVYVLVLDTPIDAANSGVIVTPLNNTLGANASAKITAAQNVTVSVDLAGVASDAVDFYVEVKQMPNT